MRMTASVCAATWVFALAPAALGAENLAPDFTALPPHAKIVVVPPDVELFEITVGGVPEPRGDWSTTARQLIHAELEKRRSNLGVETIDLDEATADDLGELLSLHAAIAQSIALHHFGGVKLPTKNGKLDWSFGDALKPLEERTGARYGLFMWVRDGYSSATRKAAMVLFAMVGVGIGGGLQSAYASLVDLDSGRVLWFNKMVRRHGDLRNADSASGTVDALLEDFPAAK